MKTKLFITMSIFMLASCFSFAALPPNRVHNVTQVEAEEKYVIDLIQRDENGNIVGGETFEVEAPYLVLNHSTLIEETPPAIKFVGYGSPAKHSLTVSLESEAPMEGSIVIASVIDGKVIGQTPIAKGEAEVNIDISGLAEGVYSATYVSNGVVADNRRFYK